MKVQTILTWIGQVVLFGAFLMFGVMKFIGGEESAATFASLGGAPAQYFTGVWEIVSAILVIIPATATIGAALIGIAMIGAILAHLFVLGFNELVIIALVMLIIATLVAIARKKSLFFVK